MGPPWFLWVLLLFDLLVALLLLPGQGWLSQAEAFARRLAQKSRAAFATMLLLSAAAYLPLLSRYGFARWTVLLVSPFAFQQARIALYGLWFAAGVFVGVPGIATGLLSKSGALARGWKGWVCVCLAAYAGLSVLPRMLVRHGVSPQGAGAVEACLWVFSCVASCFALLAMFRGVELGPSRVMDSLSRSAYVMYLVHYVFVTWAQKWLLRWPVHAGWKAVVVFAVTVALSWLTAQLLIRVPGVRAIV